MRKRTCSNFFLDLINHRRHNRRWKVELILIRLELLKLWCLKVTEHTWDAKNYWTHSGCKNYWTHSRCEKYWTHIQITSFTIRNSFQILVKTSNNPVAPLPQFQPQAPTKCHSFRPLQSQILILNASITWQVISIDIYFFFSLTLISVVDVIGSVTEYWASMLRSEKKKVYF